MPFYRFAYGRKNSCSIVYRSDAEKARYFMLDQDRTHGGEAAAKGATLPWKWS